MITLAIILIFLFIMLIAIGALLLKALKAASANMIPEILSSPLLLTAYHDGISSPIKETGGLISDAIKSIRLILCPIQVAAAYQDKLKQFLDNTIRKVEPENRILPATEIIIPILQHVKYQNNELIIEIFSNLLAAAMDKTRVSEAHPGFAFTACQLSPEEAVIIKRLSLSHFKYKVQWEIDQMKIIMNKRIIENEFLVSDLTFPHNFNMYLSHLYHLNIAASYHSFSPIRDPENNRIQTGGIDEWTVALTEYGNLFVKACTRNLND